MEIVVKRNRKLENDEEVFSQNAWDDTVWTDDMLDEAKRKIQCQKDESTSTARFKIEELESKVTSKWDEFYKTHNDKFFKDRKWLLSEYPELLSFLNVDSEPCSILEVGCGVGNAVAHLFDLNSNLNLHIYCFDVSSSAVKVLKKRDVYERHKDRITAFQADLCKNFDDIINLNIKKESINFITLIFTLSAIKPDLMAQAIKNLSSLLKTGGMILFRDYAKYDMTQLRFKGKAYLSDNYYMRADGTTSYFFDKVTVDKLFAGAGLKQLELKDDNRTLVNRQRSLKMCRRWIHAKYMK